MKYFLSLILIYLSTSVCFGGSPPQPDPDVASIALPSLPHVQYEDLGNGEVKAKKSDVIAKEHAEAQIKLQFAAVMRESAALHRQSAQQLNLSTQTLEAARFQRLEDIQKLQVIEQHMVAQHHYGVEMTTSRDKIAGELRVTAQTEMATRGQLNSAMNTLSYTQSKLQRMARTSWIPIIGPLMNMGD